MRLREAGASEGDEVGGEERKKKVRDGAVIDNLEDTSERYCDVKRRHKQKSEGERRHYIIQGTIHQPILAGMPHSSLLFYQSTAPSFFSFFVFAKFEM